MNTTSHSALSARQRRVHSAIQGVGGYWRPIAGVARLLEELGELSELLGDVPTQKHLQALSEELADICIISICTANQFNIPLEDSPSYDLLTTSVASNFYNAVSHAGRIARIVNYYDGPKNPRTFEGWPRLSSSIAALHLDIYRIASCYAIQLDEVIDRKVTKMSEIDRGRYPESYDPSTANSLQRFNSIRSTTACPYAIGASLWGAPDWKSDSTLDYNVDALVPYLISFTKVAPREDLDGFVIAIDDSALATSMSIFAKWFQGLLHTLASKDTKPSTFHEDDVAQLNWQFSFNGVRLFIAVFSPLYPPNHVRHSPDLTFVFLQPEVSFDHHGIGSLFVESETIKRDIRRRFESLGANYPSNTIDTRIESAIYLPPRWEGDQDVIWWHVEQE